jgi:CheY-like chemotaxis protein
VTLRKALASLLAAIPGSVATACLAANSGTLLAMEPSEKKIRKKNLELLTEIDINIVTRLLIQTSDVQEVFIIRSAHAHLFLRSSANESFVLNLVCKTSVNLGMAIFKAREALSEIILEAANQEAATPANEKPPPKPVATTPAAAAVPKTSIPAAELPVLLVDDSKTNRQIGAEILEAVGYTVKTAVDGEDAIRILLSRPVRLVITDLEMPRLDGFGLLRALKSDPDWQQLPVIVCTSQTGKVIQRQALNLGANSFIPKPFSREKLIEEMQKALANESKI